MDTKLQLSGFSYSSKHGKIPKITPTIRDRKLCLFPPLPGSNVATESDIRFEINLNSHQMARFVPKPFLINYSVKIKNPTYDPASNVFIELVSSAVFSHPNLPVQLGRPLLHPPSMCTLYLRSPQDYFLYMFCLN